MKALEEVMVVAYGTQKKSTFTGSASVVNSSQLEKVMGTGFAESLQGMSAGVNVVNVQGNPGGNTRIEIRGIASMSGKADPLYIVDGMPYDGDLNQISPSDIESMTILKDAAATSLYGSRAANGVVVITTKKGNTSKPQINFRGAWGTSDNAVPNPKKANPYQQLENTWYALYYDALYIDGMSTQAAGDFASNNALKKQVKAITNSNGETTYVTPFKYINENYVLHDGKGNPYMNPNLEYVWDESDWDVYGAMKRLHIFSQVDFLMIWVTEIDNIINVIHCEQILPQRLGTGGHLVEVWHIQDTAKIFQEDQVELQILLQRFPLLGCVI
jgi:TonB-dependent SusC/RagA subfamily outer membrane receptor